MYRMPLLQIRKLHQYTKRQLKPLLIVTRLIKRKIIKTGNWVSHETQSSHCLLKFCIFWKQISNNATEAGIQHFKWLGFTMQLKQIRTAPANMGGHFTTRNANTHDLGIPCILLEMRIPMIWEYPGFLSLAVVSADVMFFHLPNKMGFCGIKYLSLMTQITLSKKWRRNSRLAAFFDGLVK